MVRFFEDKAGIPLPHQRYVQLHVSGSAAQEADNFSLIGDDIVSPVLEHPQEDWAVAHELAHQWWGNVVTCADWNEFWLNEGITTFMVAAWKEQRWGRASYDREMDLARQRVSAAATAGIDVPLTFRGPFPSLSSRRAIQYSKGALFMDRLRAELGEQAFWLGLRGFTRTHAGSTVVTRDFQRALERASGRDLDPLFDEWAYVGHRRK
jgi:aminopeptidase N